MKRILYVSFFFLFSCYVNANPVTSVKAAVVAANFYTHHYPSVTPNLTLAHTEYSNTGEAIYYVFNVNSKDGFVIVSAEDAAHPILGYSNKGSYVIPNDNNNLAWFMNCRKQEIIAARNKNKPATSKIADEWMSYASNTHTPITYTPGVTVGPLLRSTWDQPYPYNAMCPGGSVTGCVATAMAQIMRYWSYPSHGHGYSGYWDENYYFYASSYGYLAANYDTSHYVWSAMPYSVTSANNEVAKLMYDCGVSVTMDYSTYESGAWVITGDYPVCAQTAYVKYFGYNPATIQGLYKSKYTTSAWSALIENELNNNRPVQYVGFDSLSPSFSEGHTWVCDGYEIQSGDTTFDMNWGWSGSDDGFYPLRALDVGYDFNWWDEILIGIEPPATSPYFSASPTYGCANLTVNFSDSSIAKSTITSYQWLFPGGSPSTSSAANPTVTYNTPGTYDVTEIVGDASGTDTLVRKAYISVASQTVQSFAQDFESSTFPPTGWVINNPHNYSYTWQLNTEVGGYGASTQCLYFNNCYGYQDYAPPGKAGLDIIGQRQQIYTPEYDYTNVTNPTIYFDIAYAPYSYLISDTLTIYYSTDCGATFNQVYLKSGLTLGTTGNYVNTGADTNNIGCFVPSIHNWRTDTIHIPAIAGVSDVMFSFENRSGNGSPLYIDNINTPVIPAGVSSVSATPSVKIFPNPGNGEFMIDLTNISGIPLVKVYNVLGEEIYTSQLKNQAAQIDLTSQPNGVYIYKVYSESGAVISTGRLIIE